MVLIDFSLNDQSQRQDFADALKYAGRRTHGTPNLTWAREWSDALSGIADARGEVGAATVVGR